VLVIEHTNGHSFGTKAKTDYSAGFRLKGISEHSKGRLKNAYAEKKAVPFARGPVDDSSSNAPAASAQFLACETQGGAYRAQTERSLQCSTP
jgi:hypothetical protein